MAKDYNHGISFANGSSHGTMVCICCGKKVVSGSYYHSENDERFNVTHRACVTDAKRLERFKKFDNDNRNELNRLDIKRNKCVAIHKEFGYIEAFDEAKDLLNQYNTLNELMITDT